MTAAGFIVGVLCGALGVVCYLGGRPRRAAHLTLVLALLALAGARAGVGPQVLFFEALGALLGGLAAVAVLAW
jgi:hypothetical protein